MGEDYDKGAFKRANRDEIMDMIKNQAVNKEGCIDPEAFKTLTPSKYLTTHDYKRRGTDYEDREEDRDAMEIMKNDEHIQVVTEIKTTTLSAMEALKRFYVTNMQVTDKTTNRIMDALKEVYEFSLKKNQDKNGRKRRELTKDVPNNDDVKVYRSFKKDQQDLMKREFKNREIEKLTFRRMYSGGPLFKTKIDDKSSKFGGVRDSNIKGHALKHRAKRQEPKNRTKSWASCWQSSLDRNESPPEELAISMFTPHQYSLSKEELFSIGSDLSKYYFVPTPKRTTKLTTLRKLKPKTVADLNEEMAFEEGNRPHTRITRMVYSLKNSSSQITSKETFSEESSSSSQITTDHNWEDFYDYSGNYDSNGVHKDSHNRTAVKLRVKREYFQYSNQREYLSQFPPPSGSYFVRQKAVRKAQKSRLFFKNMSVDALNALADKATNEINDEINNGFDNIDSTEARHVYMGVTPFNVTFRILPELPKKTTKLEISTDKNEEFDARYEISKDDTNTSHKTIYKKDLGKSPEINTVCHQNITESHESQEKDIGAYDKEIIKNMCYANPEFLTTESAPEIIASSKELGENAGHFPSTILFRDKIKTRYNPLDGINIGNDDLLSNENNMKDNKYVRLQNYTILPKQFDNHGKRSYDLYKKIKYHFEREHRPLTEVPSNTKYRILRKESIEQKRIEENIKNSLSNIKEIETSIVLHPPFVYPVNTTNENNKHVTYYQRFRSIEQMKEFKNKEDIIHMRNLPLLHHVKLFTKNGLLYKEIEKFRFVKKADTHEVQYMGNNFEAVQKYLEEVRNTPKTKRYEFHTNTITVSNETKKYNVTRYIYLNKTKTTYTENKSKYFYKTNSKFTHLAKNPYSFYTMFEKLTRKKKPQYVFVDITKKDERSKDIEVSEETKATTPTTTLSKYKFTDTTQKDESSKETKPTTTVSKYKFIDITQKDASGKKGTPTTAWSKYIFIDIRSTGLYYDRVYKYQDKNGLSRTRPSTSAPTKYIFVHKTGVHEPFNEKIKILRELQIHTDTLKCHNFSMDDLLLLKRLRYNKRNNISLTILDNQILEFFDRPELSATRPTVSTTYQFHLTYDDDEYIDETTTTHVDTDERNERFDIEEDEMNPGLYPVDHTTTKLKRKEYIELLRMKLKKDGNRQDTTLEKSLIDKFNNRLRRSIVEDRHAENITNIGDVNSTDMRGRYDNYDERRKRDITFQIREKYNRGNIRKQYSGGVLENNVEESLIDGMKRNIRNKRNIKHHHKHNSSETFEHKARQIKDKIESIKQKRHTYPRDESFQQEDLFKSFELITPRKKHNQTVDYKWSISEPNNESFEYYSKSESVKGSDYPEPEESVNSVISDPFKVFRHTFPSGSVMDPREFSTRGTTSGIRWENKPFDNFEEYDISKKMVKTRRPFDIHYFDEEIAREDELIRKGLLTTTTYRTPEPVDKNEMYSFSDEKSKELCRVWVTSDVVSNIMEKYKLTSTRSVKELLRYTHFYKMWKKNQTKPTTSTTTMFNEWAVYRHKRALGENYCPKYEDNENQAEEHKDWGVTRNLDTVLKLYTNRIKIVFDPNQSYEEIDPRFFTKKPKCEDTSVEQTNSPGSRIPSNIVKREKKDGVTMRPRNLSREYVDAVKRDKDFFIEITTRNVRKHLSGRLGKVRKIKQKKHEDENRCLVLPNSLRVIKTEKKLRVFKDFIIVKDGITTDPYKRKKAFENPKDQTRDPIQKNDANEIPTRPQDKEFADQLQQHKWTFIREESTKKYRSLKDIILNKTEDDILYKGWLEYKKNMMNTHERFRRDLDGTDEILYRTPRPKKNYGMLFDGRSTRKIRDYRAYLKVYTRPSAMRSKYYVLQEKKEKYIENNTDYEEYRKRYDAKIAEIDVNKPEDPVVFEKYFQKLSPEYNARTVGGQLLFNENIRYELENTTIDSTRKKERLLKILTECMPKSNPYYTDRNIYNESEWKRYAVMLDDSRINDRYVAEELERRPTFSPLLITQVYEVKNKRQKRDLDNKEIGDKDIHSAKYMTNHKKNKREADHNWSIFERTAPSDPPDDNFDWNTITPFPTEKPKRPGRTPYADSAICNDPDSADTEENRQKFETEMRDFFGSDIETMTEIAKERERIRENFIKQLEDKERNEKEAKEKNEGHSKKATTIRHKYSGGIMNNRAKKENFADIENKYIINENKKKMKRDTRDKQRIREIYGEYDYVETSTMQPLKKGMLTKDPLEHGQYLNFYQHLMKYNQSLFGKNNDRKENRAQKRFRRSVDTDTTTNIGTTEEYMGRYVRKNKVNRISEALAEIKMQYNLTFPTVSGLDVTLLRTPKPRGKRNVAHNEAKTNTGTNEDNNRRCKRSDRKYYMDNVEELNKQAEEFYKNLTSDGVYLQQMRRELQEEMRAANLTDEEAVAKMVLKNTPANDVFNFDAALDENTNTEERKFLKTPLTNFSNPQDMMNQIMGQNVPQYGGCQGNSANHQADDVQGHRVKRFYMSSDERNRQKYWQLYYNITGDEKLMNQLRDDWKNSNTTKIQYGMMKRDVANLEMMRNRQIEASDNERPDENPQEKLIRKRRHLQADAPHKEAGDPLRAKSRKSTLGTHKTTVNLTKEAAIKRELKEARKYGILLEKLEREHKVGEFEDEHFAEYPERPYYFQKTASPKITVWSWEATETGETVLGYDSWENLSMSDRCDAFNRSGELWYRFKGVQTTQVNMDPDKFEMFKPDVGPDGKFVEDWYQKLPDGRTFDHSVEIQYTSTPPPPEYYHKTEISLETFRDLREAYEDMPHMREEILATVGGNKALFQDNCDSHLLEKWSTFYRDGELWYIGASTVPNFTPPSEIPRFEPDTIPGGEFEKDWYQLVEGKTYKRPVDLWAYYSIPTTARTKPTPKPVRIITDTSVNDEVYDEKAVRFCHMMEYDERQALTERMKEEKEREKRKKKIEERKRRRRRRRRDNEERNENNAPV
uniref:Uncharacterized protein n=2 Tax=Cacopsylla melanoneura TaxID=428564 RepID=A0A8D8QXJ6_9HEMI